MCGNSSIDRAGAFQASGCGFDSHFPLSWLRSTEQTKDMETLKRLLARLNEDVLPRARTWSFPEPALLFNRCAGRSMVDRIVVADKMNGFDSHPALHSRVMKWQTCSPQKRDFVGSNPTSATIRESSNG